jgi:hypothetical protein
MKYKHAAGHWWLMPVIPATQEAEIRMIMRPSILKTPNTKNKG